MHKLVTNLNPKKVYARSQFIIALTLFFLALCLISWYFLVPVAVLTLYSLTKPNVTIIKFDGDGKEKLKATRKAWKKYRKINNISWKSQWDYHQLVSLIDTESSHTEVQNKPTFKSETKFETTNTTSAPQYHEKVNHERNTSEQSKKKNQDIKLPGNDVKEQTKSDTLQTLANPKNTEVRKEAKIRKVAPLPKLGDSNIKSPENMSYSLDEKEAVSIDQKAIFSDNIPNKQEIKLKEKEKSLPSLEIKKMNNYSFDVAGVSFHELSKAVTYARKNQLFAPYDNYEAIGIREEMIDEYDPVYETDLSGCIDSVSLEPEPDNKYDPNAVKVNIEIDNVKFFIGYVPTGWTQRVLGTIRRSNAGWIKIEVKGQLTGGKYKFSDLDDHIKTGKKNYGFIVTVYYENR